MMGRYFVDEDGDRMWSPYRLKFYEDERKLFPDIYSIKLAGKQEITLIFNKLVRHYKVHHHLVFHKKRKGMCNRHAIFLPETDCEMGMIAHEVAHAIDFKKRRSRHDKKLMRILGRVNAYCKKKNYWTNWDEVKVV